MNIFGVFGFACLVWAQLVAIRLLGPEARFVTMPVSAGIVFLIAAFWVMRAKK